MDKIFIKDDHIKLGQALKLAGLVESGLDAKYVIQEGEVTLNGKVETQRGKKCVSGDKICFQGSSFVIEGKNQ